ncbi:MTOR-associated protein MEAK7 isoform X3 [Palaemon carinicauda]|uniref:MTOR-associated protein MEAK7 isoform X3 n=1 Tax=Palaemon carinicauda TaxID=392227 RepID=UPI0035B6108A
MGAEGSKHEKKLYFSDEENQLLLQTLSKIDNNGEKVSTSSLQYTETVIEFFEKGVTQKTCWKTSSDTVKTQIAFALLHDLFYPNEAIKKIWGKGPPHPPVLISLEAFERWWLGHCIFSKLEMEMFKHLFKFSPAGETSLLPEATQLPKVSPTMLSAAQVMFLNGALPVNLQSKWRFLFSTSKHGWSFSIFMKQIVSKGPTIFVVEDQSGGKFGGFASVSWEVRPQFHGTPDCFLFSLQPQAGIFHTTGYNNNFMYLNYLEKNTMPNGFGMGGREELFGLWLDYDFGKGLVAPTCTTFASPQLSQHQELEISSIEVWALGPEEEDSDEEEGTRKKKSALDKNPDARAMLDMMGKVAVSDGYREEDNDD